MNKLFLTAIIGEMCLDYNVGLKVGKYSPFKLFKQQAGKAGLKIEGNKAKCILYAISIQQANKINPHPLTVKAINKMLTTNEVGVIYSDINTRAITMLKPVAPKQN